MTLAVGGTWVLNTNTTTFQSTIFQLCQDGSSWVQPVHTKQGLMCLAQGHNSVTPLRLDPAAPWSQVKHFTTEPLHSCSSFVQKLMLDCACYLSSLVWLKILSWIPILFLTVRQPWQKSCLPVHSWFKFNLLVLVKFSSLVCEKSDARNPKAIFSCQAALTKVMSTCP